jgi:hypothetical protein
LQYGDKEFDEAADNYSRKKVALAKLMEEWETILSKEN